MALVKQPLDLASAPPDQEVELGLKLCRDAVHGSNG